MNSKNNNTSKNTKLNKDKKIAIGACVLVLIVIIILLVTINGGSTKKTASPSKSTTTAALPTLSKHLCPLTDEPAPNGIVPARPALGVKIGNEPPPGNARPQSGLNEADIVYDTPAEGFIMRYIAVYQCNNASQIGPVRSIRWVDQRIMRQFIHPILVSAGGIEPNIKTAENSKWLSYSNLLGYPGANAAVRITSRTPPDNLYTSTSALYGLFPKQTTPPKPVFQYTKSLPSSAQPAADVGINFSYGTDVIWKWDPKLGQYIHTYSGQTDIDALTGKPVSTTNIFIQIVTYKFGPYPESPGSTGDVESKTIGTGKGWIVRNGKEIPVTWHRPQLLDGTTFTDQQGQEVGLAPGRTWVEMVPNTTAAVKGDITFTK